MKRQAIKIVTKYKKSGKEIKTPITDSLVGIIKDCNLDESDYKKYLEKKHF